MTNLPPDKPNDDVFDKIDQTTLEYALDVFVALTPDHKCLTVAVVNATDSEQKLDLNVAGTQLSGPSTRGF